MRIIKLNKGKLAFKDDGIEGFLERTVTPTGNSAKVDVPRRYLNRKAYVIICKE